MSLHNPFSSSFLRHGYYVLCSVLLLLLACSTSPAEANIFGSSVSRFTFDRVHIDANSTPTIGGLETNAPGGTFLSGLIGSTGDIPKGGLSVRPSIYP